MDENFFRQMDGLCHRINQMKCKKVFLYPFGYKGLNAYEFLKTRTNYEILCVDEKLGKESNDIITFEEMVEVGTFGGVETDVVVLTSNNPSCYSEVRLKVRRYIGKEFVIDMFPRHPLIFHNDARIGSLAAVAENIYRQNIDGSVAEAGVYRGDFAKYMNMLFPDRKCFLFDTFEGFDRNQLDLVMDDEQQTDYWIDALKNTSEELVISKMTYPELVEIKKGFFPTTTEGIEDCFAFVNLDMDIFLPTYEGLLFFWQKLNPGGVIFVHDFNNYAGINKAVEKFCKKLHIGYVPLNDGATAALVKDL